MRRISGAAAIAAAVVAIGLTACGSPESAEQTPTTAGSPDQQSETATADLATLVPPPAGATVTRGPDEIADGGIHLYYQVDGVPKDAMTAFRDVLAEHGWDMTTVITSGGGDGGGATYTGQHGDAYGVFDGGGFQTTTYINVCAWPAKPAEPNCTRGDR